MLEEEIDDVGERGWIRGTSVCGGGGGNGASHPLCKVGRGLMGSDRCKWLDSVFPLRVRVVMRTSDAAGERNCSKREEVNRLRKYRNSWRSEEPF